MSTVTHRCFALVGALCLGGTPCAVAASHVVQGLTATSHAPGARGRASLVLPTAATGRLHVSARGLAPDASFDVVIGGIKVATLTTTPLGTGKVKLSTRPHGATGLLGVDPRGKAIEVRDDNGDDDLEGDMPGDDGSASGVFACCASDDDGTECEVETADECTGNGGTSQTGVTSCIPNPCGVTPPSEVVCCLPASGDNQEAECDEVSMQECATAGGTVVAGTSCDPNPCAPVPSPQVVACCVPDGDELDCEEATPDDCTAAGGSASGATSCDPDPCMTSTTTTTESATTSTTESVTTTTELSEDIQCCKPDDGLTVCDEESPAECTADQGVNMGVGTCDPNPCIP